MLFGRDMTITVQRVDLGYDTRTDLPTTPIVPLTSRDRDDVWITVQKVDLGYRTAVDYDGFLRLGGIITGAVFVTDDMGLVIDVNGAGGFAETVTLTEDFQHVIVIGVNVDDTMAASDTGMVQYYDYAGTDYFVTPYDYVGHREFW